MPLIDVFVGLLGAYVVYRQETIERELRKLSESMQRVLGFLDIED